MVVERASDSKTTPAALAALARAFCALQEQKRILRGIPLPGQLRPDLDPVQLARALRRQKDRTIHEIQAQTAECTFLEDLPDGAQIVERD
jgi:hypothetical protein